MQSAKTKTCFKFGTKTHRTDSLIIYCFTYNGSITVIEYTESWVSRALFKKGTCCSCWKSPTFRFWRERKRRQNNEWLYLEVSQSYPPTWQSEHLKQATTIIRDVYKDITFCNISQGVYGVLLCRRIQTNQIGTMYEPFSCRIWSFANAEQQILLISMLIFTFVLSMLLRWIVLKHSAIWKSATSDFFYCIRR